MNKIERGLSGDKAYCPRHGWSGRQYVSPATCWACEVEHQSVVVTTQKYSPVRAYQCHTCGQVVIDMTAHDKAHQEQPKENNMNMQEDQIPEIDGVPTPYPDPMMRCEHDWVDSSCGAIAPEGTRGWEQRHGRDAVYWLCPQSIAELSPDAVPYIRTTPMTEAEDWSDPSEMGEPVGPDDVADGRQF